MQEITLDDQRTKLRDYERAFEAFYLLKIGVDLGLFQKLNAFPNGAYPGALASELGLHEPYVKYWCQTAYHLEILECDKSERFSLAPHMGSLLADPKHPFYFVPVIEIRFSHTAEHLKDHPEYYRSGRIQSWEERGQDFSKKQKAYANQTMAAFYLSMIVPSVPGLKKRLEGGIRVLDVGCGSGYLIVELAKAFPNSEFVGIDIEGFAIDDAQKCISDNGVASRVSALLADAACMNYDQQFDIVNMAVTLHEIGADLKRGSIANCYKALKASGQILILDFAYPETLKDFREPKYALAIMDQFHEMTWGTEHLPSGERDRLLLEHGFRDITSNPLIGGSMEITWALK